MKKIPFPPKAVVFTFDDGYADNYQAYEILKKYSVQGTFYITPGCINGDEPLWLFEIIYLISNTEKKEIIIVVDSEEKNFSFYTKKEKEIAIRQITTLIKSKDLKNRESLRQQLQLQLDDVKDFSEKAGRVMLSWEQVQRMAEDGMDIGGHTMTHLNLPNADPADAFSEIEQCKKVIENNIGKEVHNFSYPNGGDYDYYNDTVREFVVQCGYSTSTTSNNGLVSLKSNPFELERIRVTAELSEIIYQMNCEPFVGALQERFL